jgi:molybdopterin/thiamine biosynthesis adenylyltransferase
MQSIDRYKRQVLLPEVGASGQSKIANAKVLLIGAGGLGSAASFYLAAAGVGVIGIVDGDRLEMSNLNRQILHNPKGIDELKAISAKQTLERCNPSIKIVVYPTRFKSADELYKIIVHYDLVLDCTDNYPTRYDINDACVQAGKTWIYGAVAGFEGQAMTIVPGQSACYRCLYPSPPPVVEGAPLPGVIGVMPGIIGTMQATEALKYLLGNEYLLVGRLLFIDLLEMSLSKLKVSRNPKCPSCGSA